MVDVSLISALLRQLLYTHNRVSLPGVGAFMADLNSASLIKGGRAMLPPSKRITFSATETWNDGLLEEALAKDQEYTPEGARKQVAAFSQKLVEQLTAGRRIEFPELGMMRMTDDREWRFTPFDTTNADPDSFGLLELEMPPVTPAPVIPVTPPPPPPPAPPTTPYTPPKPPVISYTPPRPPVVEPPERNRSNTLWWILLILLLLLAGVYLLRHPIIRCIERSYYTPEELEYLYGHQPAAKPAAVTPPAPAPEAAVTPRPVAVRRQKPAPRPATGKGKTRRYETFHILLAQFDADTDAKAYAQRIREQAGYATKVLHTGNNTYKVSALRYPSKQEAEEILEGLRSTDSSEFYTAWVEKY
jgi:cell division septation protein DedD